MGGGTILRECRDCTPQLLLSLTFKVNVIPLYYLSPSGSNHPRKLLLFLSQICDMLGKVRNVTVCSEVRKAELNVA